MSSSLSFRPGSLLAVLSKMKTIVGWAIVGTPKCVEFKDFECGDEVLSMVLQPVFYSCRGLEAKECPEGLQDQIDDGRVRVEVF